MYAAFVKLLNMSLASGILIAVVMVLRFLLRKVPKKFICILWALVGLRLICPFSISSAMSAYNYIGHSTDSSGQVEYIHYNGKSEKPKAEVTIPIPTESEKHDGPTFNFTTKAFYIPTFFGFWATGFASMVFYAGYSYTKVRMQVQMSIPLGRRNYLRDIYLCDEIPSPFILGVVKPKIYLPSILQAQQQDSVIAHERAHIARRDHWWKPLGFLLLSVHWFNPMVWTAYAMLCRDIEMACDEKVISKMTPAQKQVYSTVLLTCSMPRKAISACPLAFGEAGVKERVKGILNYRKPSFWIVATALVACLTVAAVFLTNPMRQGDYLRLRQSETKNNQPHFYSFEMHTGKTVQGPIVYAELWQKGTLVQSEHCVVSQTAEEMWVTMVPIRNGDTLSGYCVELRTNPNESNLNVTFALPEDTYPADEYAWHGRKDIPLEHQKEILLAASILSSGRNGFMIFDFDNEDFAEAGDRLRNQDFAVVVRAVFEQPLPIDSSHDGYWEVLRKGGLIHTEDGVELFHEYMAPADWGEISQEELDSWNGIWYQSALMAEDGSAVYKMTREQYDHSLNELEERLERMCESMPESVRLRDSIQSITHNSDFTHFFITIKSGDMKDFDKDELTDTLWFFAQRYSLYTTGSNTRKINFHFQDSLGNLAEYTAPTYRLRIGTHGVFSIIVDTRGNTIYGYGHAPSREYSVGEYRELPCLGEFENLIGVQIWAKDAEDQTIWHHTFSGEEEFPWEENGWQIEQINSDQISKGDQKSLLD